LHFQEEDLGGSSSPDTEVVYEKRVEAIDRLDPFRDPAR
jgi:hypothetical protein